MTERMQAARRAASKKKPGAIPEKQTKAQIIAAIAEETALTQRDVHKVFVSLSHLIERHMKKHGSGELTIPETGIRIRRVLKPAGRMRRVISSFSGQAITVRAEPAHHTVKLSALKSLKDKVA